MKMSRCSEQQIAFILRQVGDGTTDEAVCRNAGISIQTYYRWRSKYGGFMLSEMKRLKQLKEENVLLKRLVANLSLDKEMLQDVIKRSRRRSSEARPTLQGLIGPVSWSAICSPVTASVSSGPVMRYSQAGQPSVTSPAAPIRPETNRSWRKIRGSCQPRQLLYQTQPLQNSFSYYPEPKFDQNFL